MTVTTLRSLAAYEQNEQRLFDEQQTIIQTLQETIQAQITTERGLLDKITILQAEVAEERGHTAALEKALQTERVASAALERQVQQLQAENRALKTQAAILDEAKAILDTLKTSKEFKPLGRDYRGLSPYSARRAKIEDDEQGETRYQGVPSNKWLDPLLEVIDRKTS